MKSGGAVLSWESTVLHPSHGSPRQPVCPGAGLSQRAVLPLAETGPFPARQFLHRARAFLGSGSHGGP